MWQWLDVLLKTSCLTAFQLMLLLGKHVLQKLLYLFILLKESHRFFQKTQHKQIIFTSETDNDSKILQIIIFLFNECKFQCLIIDDIYFKYGKWAEISTIIKQKFFSCLIICMNKPLTHCSNITARDLFKYPQGHTLVLTAIKGSWTYGK